MAVSDYARLMWDASGLLVSRRMHRWWLHCPVHAVRVESHIGGWMLMLYGLIHAQIIGWRLAQSTLYGLERRMVREVMRWETVLLVHLEWVDIVERWMLHELLLPVEIMKGSRLMTSMQSTF